jgi:hypothetical protein
MWLQGLPAIALAMVVSRPISTSCVDGKMGGAGYCRVAAHPPRITIIKAIHSGQ